MLKNQDAVPEPQISVSQARVTPEELTQALAAIETRKQAEAARLAGTIPIDQAISDLHLDSTPDEIWTEVQKQRAKAAAAQEAKPQAETPQVRIPPKIRIPPVQTRLPSLVSLQPHKPGMRLRGWRRLLAPFLAIGVLMGAGVIPHSFIPQFWSSHQSAAAPIVSSAAPILHSLASIPVDQEVYADDFALTQIAQGKPASQITISQNLTGNRWPIVKKDNHHIYVRGYIERADSLNDLQGKPLNIYNDDNSSELHGDSTSNLTLRIDNIPFQKSSGDDKFSGITISNFQFDPLTLLTPGR